MTQEEAKQIVEELAEEVRGLRHLAEQSEARLLARIYEIERDHLDTIKLSGCASFAQWLNSSRLVHPARYENFKAGVAVLGGDLEQAVKIGANPTIALKDSRDPEKVSMYIEAIQAETEHRHVAPSEKAAHDILRQVDPRPEVPLGLRKKSRIQELEEENAKLRLEVKKLKAQIRWLEKKSSAECRAN